jgi:hypothetical protein
MKAVRLGDLRELLESTAFGAWWTDWQRATSTVRDARLRHEDLVAQSELMALRSEIAQRAGVDAFSRSGEIEDEGTRWSAGAQTDENRALALVGEYEQQRARASDAWVHLGGAEESLEERREAAASDRSRARETLEAGVRDAERQRQSLAEEYEAADRTRKRLWDEVEAAWGASFERSLVGAEHAVVARRVRRDAERLFAEAEERRARARQLAADAGTAKAELRDAEARLEALRAAARDRFGCVPGVAFLYWRHHEDKRSAFAVSLADDPDATPSPVKALGIYVVGRQRGVALLEPARDGAGSTAEERDRKIDQFLARREDGPPSK